MANKTLYVRDADLPLWDRAQKEWGTSISGVFSDFLRQRFDPFPERSWVTLPGHLTFRSGRKVDFQKVTTNVWYSGPVVPFLRSLEDVLEIAAHAEIPKVPLNSIARIELGSPLTTSEQDVIRRSKAYSTAGSGTGILEATVPDYRCGSIELRNGTVVKNGVLHVQRMEFAGSEMQSWTPATNADIALISFL